MSQRRVNESSLTATADALRAKLGTVDPIPWVENEGFKEAVEAIQTGAGAGGPLQAKTVYPSHDEQIIAPDEDYYGLVSVTVKGVPRVPACVVSVESAYQKITVTDIPYSVHAGAWFIYTGGVSAEGNPAVVYSFPVLSGVTYTVAMIEIGNRLRMGFTTVDPSLITGNEGSIVSDFVDDTSSLAVGYQFEYTPTENGWYLVYVSNQDERPAMEVTTTTEEWIAE